MRVLFWIAILTFGCGLLAKYAIAQVEIPSPTTGADSASAGADSLNAATIDSIGITAPDSIQTTQINHRNIADKLLLPLGVTILAGGALLLLYTQRGR